MTRPTVVTPRRAAWLAAALAAVALSGCAGGDAQPSPAATGPATTGPATTSTPTAAPEQPRRPEREAAPDLRVTAFDGRTVTLGAFRGRPVVVNFFESW